MFKRFDPEESISANSQVKSSVQRGIRAKILEQYPLLEEVADDILPKKTPMFVAKCQNHIQIIIQKKEPLFFNVRDGPYLPTLRLLHKYPSMMSTVTVDRGGIPYVLSGANVMCPGLTSAGGAMPDQLEVDDPVAIKAEGKVHPMAVGVMKMSTDQIRTKNKGIAIENAHFLDDGLWTNNVIG